MPRGRPRQYDYDELTPREMQVLQHAGAGHSFDSTAASLGLSPQTVATYAKQLRAKLGARNMAHAFAIAYRRGLVT